MLVVHGIANCDTIRRCRRWLDEHGIAYRFHDLRKDGLPPELLDGWIAALGWEALLNTRGTTWRKLTPSQRDGIDAAGARTLMLEQPSLIRRPVLDAGGRLRIGFEADSLADWIAG